MMNMFEYFRGVTSCLRSGVIENTAAKYFISLFTVVFSFPVLMLVMEEPTASGVFCNRMLSMVNSEDVNAIIQAQRHM